MSHLDRVTKVCGTCEQDKPIGDFEAYANGRGYRSTRRDCRPCSTAKRLTRKHRQGPRRRQPESPREQYERFMTHVDTSGGTDACWRWTGSVNYRGYGRFFADGGTHIASRWLLGHLQGRDLAANEFALHHCDNPPCANPKHLYVGSTKDNTRDAIARGRHHRRERQTECINGHEFTPENTRIHVKNGHRYQACVTCIRKRQVESRRRRRAA